VSRIVATLLSRGLISRRTDPSDLRAAFLHLTPLGKAVQDECTLLALDFLKRLEEAIPAADRDAVDRTLARLAALSRRLIRDGSRPRSS
jgi:DNA-binding MarR family transcriptional regulator